MTSSRQLSLVCGLTIGTIGCYYYYRRQRQLQELTGDDYYYEPSLTDSIRHLANDLVAMFTGGVGGGHRRGSVVIVRQSLNTHYVQVPQHLVPQIIGRSAHNIKQLEAETGTAIHFANELTAGRLPSDTTDDTTANGDDITAAGDGLPVPNETADDIWDEKATPATVRPYARRPDYRVMSIRGDADGCRRAVAIVEAIIRDNTYDKLDIPFGLNVVGPGGQTIRDLEDSTGARLKLEGSRYAQHRVLIISGTADQRLAAKQAVQSMIDNKESFN